jgi:hypothetical protein
MVNFDLERFRLKLREYRLLVNRNQSDLASYINLDYNELSNRLNFHKNARLSHDNVRAIVRALAEWGAITTRSQAEELLNLMLCPHFDPVDLQAGPLSKLTTNPIPDLVSNLEQNPGAAYATSSPLQQNPPFFINTHPVTRPEPLHNLSQQLSSFIGRAKEIAKLEKLLVEE